MIALPHEAMIAVEVMRAIVRRHFSEPMSYYRDLADAEFHAEIADAQDEINRRAFGRRLVLALRDDIAEYLGSTEILLQRTLYLRAARPSDEHDIVDWHRESFYGAPPETVNLWIPLLNVTEENTPRYVPGTANLPADAITTIWERSEDVTQGSSSHKIGLLYAPKRIVAGVDFETARPFHIPAGSAALFPGELVHGAAINRSDKIRFSVDLRLLARAHEDKAKPGYFVPLN
jgi:hypothetical protein